MTSRLAPTLTVVALPHTHHAPVGQRAREVVPERDVLHRPRDERSLRRDEHLIAPYAELSELVTAPTREAAVLSDGAGVRVAGRQPLRPESLDPSAVLAELVPMFGRALGPRIAVSVNVAPGTPNVYADPTQLRTALLNLAANARDAMDGTGRLVITVGPDREGNVAFSVTDEGSGMSEDVAARAFEPFFTTKPACQGSGLGLSQAYGFVAQSRGTIELESTPGFGTTVRFVLPSASGDGRPRLDAEGSAHAALVA